jgi:serine/threonine protein kinase
MLDAGQPLPIPFALRILGEAAAALGHAHARGVVHRDVKPANIMLGADDQVVLTDFGISKVGDLTAQLTQTGMIIGTPHYMAPEQATGRDVDGRADQYSLAVLGHQLFTGKLLFSGDSAHTIIYRHVSEQPPRVVSLRPDVPPAVDAALDRALRKEPDERFATMEDFARAMRGESVAGAVTAKPSTRALNAATVRMARPAKRKRPSRKRAVVATLTVLGAAGALAAWTLVGRQDVAGSTMSPPAAPPLPVASVDTSPSISQVASNPAIDSVVPAPVAPTNESKARPIAQGAGALRAGRRTSAPPAGRSRDARQDQRSLPARQFARLTVASEPYGTLFVDGVEIGDTPIANYSLPVGQRVELRVERDGYKTKRESIMISGPNAIRRRYILESGEQP